MKRKAKGTIPLGENIRKIRQEKKVNQTDLAKAASISTPYLSQIESGKVDNPTLEIVKRIADGLSVSISQLIGEQEAEEKFEALVHPSPFDIEDLVEPSSKIEGETEQAKLYGVLQLIKNSLTDSTIPLKKRDEMKEQVLSFVEWLRDRMRKKN